VSHVGKEVTGTAESSCQVLQAVAESDGPRTNHFRTESRDAGGRWRNTNGTKDVSTVKVEWPRVRKANLEFSLHTPQIPKSRPSIPEVTCQQNPPPPSLSLALTAFPTPTDSEAIQALSLFARDHEAVINLDEGSNGDSAEARDPVFVNEIEAQRQIDISGHQACDLVSQAGPLEKVAGIDKERLESDLNTLIS
jgi:hypothetical protein